MKLDRVLAAGVLVLVAALFPSTSLLAGALLPFGSLATVSGTGTVGATDFHIGSLQASFANTSFNAGSASNSEAEASAAVNALSASVTSFNAPFLRAWAEYEDTITISAPAGTTVVPIAVGVSFFPKLEVLAGGTTGGYAYAVKDSQIFVTGFGTGFFSTLLARDCLSVVEPGASISDPCAGFDPSTNKTSAVMLIPVGTIGIDAALIAEAGAVPGCTVDSDGNNFCFGSFAAASDPFRVSLTPLIPGVSIMSASGASYAALASTVPEPATVILLAAGLAGLGFSRRKRASN